MKIVSEDVEGFFETFQEKVDLIKKQKRLQEMSRKEKYNGIIGLSPPMKNIFDTLELIKSAENPVLLEGETGKGKETRNISLLRFRKIDEITEGRMIVEVNANWCENELQYRRLKGIK